MALEDYNYLTVGMSGEGVREMQGDLVSLGFSLPRYGVDGDFGSETQQAVKDFQYTWGITVDGVVGSQTAGAIKEALGLKSMGQWNVSMDPSRYSSVTTTRPPSMIPRPSVTQPPLLTSTTIPRSVIPQVSVAGIDLKWIGLGVLGITLLFYLMKKEEEK